MHPLLIADGVVGGGLVLKHFHDKKVQADTDREHAFKQMANELITGKTYAVQMMLDPSATDWPPQAHDRTIAEQYIKTFMEQLGWKILSPPKLRNEAEASAFVAGKPSQWVFNGTWRRAEKFMPGGPKWLGMAIPYLLPTV